MERLLSEHRKQRALRLHRFAAIGLLSCAAWPHWISTSMAGLLMAIAWGDTALALRDLGLRVDAFAAQLCRAQECSRQEVVA